MLLLSFHAFRQGSHAHGPSHGEGGRHDGATVWVSGQVPDERGMNFEFVSLDQAQIAQGGVARSEVIDGKTDAETAQLLNGELEFLGSLHRGRFSEFHLQELSWHPRLTQQGADLIGQIDLPELQRRQVHGSARRS